MPKVGAQALTERERSALYGMCRHPTLNDRELGLSMGMRTSTVTAIRHRLVQRRLVRKVRVPMPQRLGKEIFFVGYGSFSRPGSRAHREVLGSAAESLGPVFLFAEGGANGFFMGAAKNYTETKKCIDGFAHSIHGHDLAAQPWTYVIFPFQVSKVLNFFDMSHVVARLLGVRGADEVAVPQLSYEECGSVPLSQKARDILAGLSMWPEESDIFTAEQVGASRQAVSRLRKRFEDGGVLKTLYLPDLKALGGELMALSHVGFNPRCVLRDRREGVRMLLRESPHVFVISGSFECVMLHAFRDYQEYEAARNKLYSFYRSHEFLQGEPRTVLFSSENPRYLKYFDFAGML
ncbi:MAG: hypothetical protein HZB92_07045 [Euryarchaeota archaeon]|nr:hypothetical protein [Euryarchaeota archaeon]